MDERKFKTVSTSRGELRYYRDWDNFDGGVVMMNPQTIDRYNELRKEHPDADKYDVFFAFNNQQAAESIKKLKERGSIKDESELRSYSPVGGLFGTEQGIRAFLDVYRNKDKVIVRECDPQEVYFHEYNNHECMISWDGDADAIRLVIDIWGRDAAEKITRIDAAKTIKQLLKE